MLTSCDLLADDNGNVDWADDDDNDDDIDIAVGAADDVVDKNDDEGPINAAFKI